MTDARLNTRWARSLIDELIRLGVRDVSLAPGSRSTPLVMAAARRAELRVRVHLDERSAAFFALGQGKLTGRPSVVITTSGTAAANLLPAVVESATSDTPLLILTADRPARFRGLDSNQAIDQLRLFGPFSRMFLDLPLPSSNEDAGRHLRVAAARAIAAALGEPSGPVHLNVPFEKPLEPPMPDGGDRDDGTDSLAGWAQRDDDEPFTAVGASGREPSPDQMDRLVRWIDGARSGIIVAGPGACRTAEGNGSAILALAARLGWPVLADPLSGVRFCGVEPAGGSTGGSTDGIAGGSPDWVIGAYDLILRSGSARERLVPSAVLRFGASSTSSRLVDFLETHSDVPQVVVDAGGRWKDHAASAAVYLRADPVRVCARLDERLDAVDSGSPAPVTVAWLRAESAARDALAENVPGAFFEGQVLRTVVDGLAEATSLFISNSMPIRDLDAFVSPRRTRLHLIGNRGASGIDGIVSTALGVASVSVAPTVAVMGDLAFLHDLNGLFAARSAEEGPGAVFVVIDNDGGGIFHMLPIREHEPEFTQFFATPHGLDLGALGTAYGIRCETVESEAGAIRRALDKALAAVGSGDASRILIIKSNREDNRRRRDEVVAAVVAAVEAAVLPNSQSSTSAEISRKQSIHKEKR